MDPLSHALLGAASAAAIARRDIPMAALAGLSAALLPDLDFFIESERDPLVNLEYHRQFTHSLIAAPVGALVVAGILWLVLRAGKPFAQLYWPALAGYASAVLLDACTSYGTQLLWPFTDQRFAWSVVAIVDPVVTLVLLVGVVAALRAAAAKPARIAVAVALLYLGFGWVQRERAESVVEQLAAERGHAIRRHEVKPTLGNLLLWRSIYLTGDRFVVDAVRVGLLANPVVYPGGAVKRIEPLDLVPPLSLNSVQATDVVRFGVVSEGFLVRHPSRPHVIGDIRYSILPNDIRPLWGIEIDPEREDRHVAFRTFREFTREDRERFVAMLRGEPPSAWRRRDHQRDSHLRERRRDETLLLLSVR